MEELTLEAFKQQAPELAGEVCSWLSEVSGHPKQIGKLKEVVCGVLLHLTVKMQIQDGSVYLRMPSGAEFKSAGIRSHRWIVVGYVNELARLGIWEVDRLDPDLSVTEGIWIPLDRGEDQFRKKQAQGEWGAVRTVKSARLPLPTNAKLTRKRSYKRVQPDRLHVKMIPDAPTQLLLALFDDGIKTKEAAEMMHCHKDTARKRLENLVLCGMAEKQGTKYTPLPPCASFAFRQEIINGDSRQRKATRRMLIDLRDYFQRKVDCFKTAKNPPVAQVRTAARRLQRSIEMIGSLEQGVGLDRVAGLA